MIKLIHTKKQVIDQAATGAAIRRARKRRRLSQYQVAKAIKRTKAYVSMLELGKGNITEAKLKELNDAIYDKETRRRIRP